MKTLNDHTILYDDECPLCKHYTNVFINSGMLDKNGREAYIEMKGKIECVDWDRARNEIAMVNRKDNTVTYGVEAITAIVVNRFTYLKPITDLKVIQWFLKRLYRFISYNRKALAPGSVFEGVNTCTPDMNLIYRWTYIVFAWLVTSTILFAYSKLAIPLVPVSNFAREFLICGGQIAFQGAIVFALNRHRVIHYLGNVMTVSLGGALLLLPALVLQMLIESPAFFIVYFIIVVSIMFFEHYRRVKILELHWVTCWTWVLYRFIALYFIL